MPFAQSLRPGQPSLAPGADPGATTPPASPNGSRRRKAWSTAAWTVPAVLAFAAGGWLMSTKDAARTQKARAVASASMKTLDDGAHVRWHGDSIDVVLDQTFVDLAGADLFGNAINAWRATGAELPSISTAPGTGRHVGYDPAAPNENVVVFAPYGWAKANGALAVTILTYDDASGAIVDADLLVNGGGRYFANFDHDESSGDQNMIAIENPASTGSGQATTAQTPRFDLQSVVTHELGHFLGLGDDEDDNKTTMYARTAPGEIHKRLLTATDANIITALYAEATPSGSKVQGGCGGGHVASGGANAGRSWIGFAGALAGFAMLVVARRRRWRLGRAIGAFLAAIGTVTFLAPPEVSRASEAIAARGDARVQIVKIEPRRVDGIVQTSLTYRVTACHVAQCPQDDQQVVVYGGKLDGKTQVVGPFAVPEPGAEVAVSLRDGRGLLKTLKPRFLP